MANNTIRPNTKEVGLRTVTFKIPSDIAFRAKRLLNTFGLRTAILKKALLWACDVAEIDHEGEFFRAALHDGRHPLEMILIGLEVMQKETYRREEEERLFLIAEIQRKRDQAYIKTQTSK